MKKGVDFIGVSAGAMIFNDLEELFFSKRGKGVTKLDLKEYRKTQGI